MSLLWLARSAQIICVPNPSLAGGHYRIAYQTLQKQGRPLASNPLFPRPWFIRASLIFPRPTTLFVYPLGMRENPPPLPPEWEDVPEIGFTTSPEGVFYKTLTSRDRLVLRAILRNPIATLKELARETGLTPSNIAHVLARLRERNVFARITCVLKNNVVKGELYQLLTFSAQGGLRKLREMLPQGEKMLFVPFARFPLWGSTWQAGFLYVWKNVFETIVSGLHRSPWLTFTLDYKIEGHTLYRTTGL